MQFLERHKTEVMIFLIVVILRILFMGVLFYAESNLDKPFPLAEIDSREYYQLAENLKDSHAFSASTGATFEPNSNRVPGYPLFVAVILTVFRSIYAVPIVQAFIAGAIAVLTYRLGIMLFKRRAIGIGAAVLFALDPVGLYFSNSVMTETLFIFLLLFVSYIFFRDTHRPYKTAIGVGLLLGALILVRPISATLPVIFIIAYPFRYNIPWGKIVLLMLTMLISMLALIFPWMLRNKFEFNAWSLSSVSSYNLYYYNALRYYAKSNGVSEKEAQKTFYKQLLEVDPGAPEQRVDYSVKDAPYLKRLALEYIGRDPIGYAIFHVSTLIPFFLTDGVREILHATGFAKEGFLNLRDTLFSLDIRKFFGIILSGGVLPIAFLGGFTVWGAITLLMALGIALGLYRRDTRLATFVLSAIIAIMALSSGVVTTARFRYAITPLIFLLASLAVYEIIHYHTKLQRA